MLRSVGLLLIEFIALPFIVMPIVWLILTMATAFLLKGYLAGARIPQGGEQFALPVMIFLVSVTAIIWALLYRFAMDWRLKAPERLGQPSRVPPWLDEILTVGGIVLSFLVYSIVIIVLVFLQAFLWGALGKFPAKLLHWDFASSEADLLPFALAFLFVLAPSLRTFHSSLKLPKQPLQ